MGTRTTPAAMSATGLAADTIAQFLLLCAICELPNRIFFPALVEMGFSGLEPLLAIHLLSALLGISRLWSLSVYGSGALVLMAMPGFYFYADLANHYERTAYVAASVIALTLAVQGPAFWSAQRNERLLWAQQLAVVFMLCLRYAFKSALPVWSYHRSALPEWSKAPEWSWEAPECDKYAAVVGACAAVALLVESRGEAHPHVSVSFRRWLPTALAMGANMFMTLWFYTCHSAIPRWVGVDPTVYGPGVIIAYMAGCLLAKFAPASVQSPLLGMAGAAGAWLLYYADPLPAYIGGLMVSVFTAASWAPTYANMLKCGGVRGRMLFVGQLTFVFLEFTTVWNIAYMFLDLGDAFREAPHYPLFFSIAALSLNNMMSSERPRTTSSSIGERTLVFLFLALLLPSLYVRHAYGTTRPHRVQHVDGEVKVMIWNVHTGYADNGYDNYELSAAFLQDMGAGVIAILENDQARPCTGNRDQIEYFGASLGFKYHNYGVKTRDSTWGCSFISLYPIKDSNVTVLPSPYGTRSCLIDAVLDVDGNDFNVVVSHFSTEEFPEDLKLQTKALSARTMHKNDMPMVVMCYITSAPTSATWKKAEDRANYGTLVSTGTLKDPDPSDFDRWCQYIFYKNTEVKKYYHVDTGYLSDTEAQLADVRVVPNKEAGSAKVEGDGKAEFYKYLIEQRELKYWYTGARHRHQRPPPPLST